MIPHRVSQILPAGSAIIGAVILGVTLVVGAPHAGAEVEPDKKLAYLIGVTTRPGYNFASADEALEYGYGICAKVAQGVGYAQLVAEVQGDFNTSDDYQASYLISQAANELCPELIWQLRNSAAHYRPQPVQIPRYEETRYVLTNSSRHRSPSIGNESGGSPDQ